MGFYDFRCMVSGVSLKGSDAVLVLLRRAPGGGYSPVTLGVKGSYNRFGSIDFIEEDRNTDLVLAWFTERARDGRFVLDPAYERSYGNPPNDIEGLLNYFERNVSDSTEEHPAAALDSLRLVSTLIARPVWEALAAIQEAAPDVCFPDPFAEIYQGCLGQLASHHRELLAINDFVASRGSAWRPQPDDDIGAQHFAEEMSEYLDAARREFADVPAVLAALDGYDDEAYGGGYDGDGAGTASV